MKRYAFLLFLAPLLEGGAVPIDTLVVEGGGSSTPAVLLIGGLAGEDAGSKVIRDAVAEYRARPVRPYPVIAIPVANPEKKELRFPPPGTAYRDYPESHTLWRWIGTHAPGLVLIAGDDSGLAQALSTNAVAGLGSIPARRLEFGIEVSVGAALPASAAHLERDRRQKRTAAQFADELAKVYGHDFDQVTYLPGMALIGQLRLGNLAEVEKLAAPYASGAKNSLGARPTSLTLAGHLVFGELAARTKDERYVALVRKAADLGFTETGEMKESMPFHDEMSDSVFMGTSIAARAGKLTGERKYFDIAARHLTFMDKLVLRPDGLYRHSPLTDAAWGRGNAFPALGLALSLSDFPRDHAEYNQILASYRRFMETLAKFQDADGLWHEVIDEPASYAETSATSMIGFAMLRGIRNGWLDATVYQPRVDRAWKAVLTRVSSDGVLIDVCESTNKQRTLQDYLNRAALLGPDVRGGGMALLFATEMSEPRQ